MTTATHGTTWIDDNTRAPFHVDGFTSRGGNVISLTLTEYPPHGKPNTRTVADGDAAFDTYSNAIVDWPSVVRELLG